LCITIFGGKGLVGMKFKKTPSGVKVFNGKKYTYAFQGAEPLGATLLVQAPFESNIRITMKVKDFKTAKQIIECLER